jgi:hypothetical protein
MRKIAASAVECVVTGAPLSNMPDEKKPHGAETPHPAGARVPVILATTVMLTFISFWRAAAIVLCDLGSSAFYVGGISEQAIGKAAPWLILGVMCISYSIRAVYIEACVMFVRGGVYRVVKSALGDTLAKLSVSALWRVPFNIRLGGRELPLGILVVLVILLATGLTNLVTKQVATISGLIFTAAFFVLFTVSERTARKKRGAPGQADRKNLGAGGRSGQGPVRAGGGS